MTILNVFCLATSERTVICPSFLKLEIVAPRALDLVFVSGGFVVMVVGVVAVVVGVVVVVFAVVEFGFVFVVVELVAGTRVQIHIHHSRRGIPLPLLQRSLRQRRVQEALSHGVVLQSQLQLLHFLAKA